MFVSEERYSRKSKWCDDMFPYREWSDEILYLFTGKDKAAAFFGTPMTRPDLIGLSTEPIITFRSFSGQFNYVCFAYTPFNRLRL